MSASPYATYDEILLYTRATQRAAEEKVRDILQDASDTVGQIARVAFSNDELAADMDADDITVPVTELSYYPKEGMLIIGDERMTYQGKSADSEAGDLLAVVRASYNTEAASHDAGTPIVVMPLAYAERRRRCEKRLFDYFWFTDGGIKKQESLTGVGARQFYRQNEVRRIVKSVMGSTIKKSHRIV